MKKIKNYTLKLIFNIMNKTIIISVLLLLIIGLTGCNRQVNSQNEQLFSTQEQSESKEISKVDKIEIIDFHNIRRCVTCLSMEENAKATLDKYFQKELESGMITFRSVNIEESISETAELVQKYKPVGTSLFVNVIRDGEDHIEQDLNAWKLARKDEEFEVYFKGRIEGILE